MLANQLRLQSPLSKFKIFPTADGQKAEFMTGARGRGKGKRVDVSVSSLSAGLQIGLSLKGGNFLDGGNSGYGKNLTGRLYELLDETKAIHEYHPHALIACVYFFPIEATVDKPTISTFARAVSALRAHTGRSDPLAISQMGRFDKAYIGLYVPHECPTGLNAGACRFFDVENAPPKRGRPVLSDTLSLDQLLNAIIDYYKGGEHEPITYSDPEPDG